MDAVAGVDCPVCCCGDELGGAGVCAVEAYGGCAFALAFGDGGADGLVVLVSFCEDEQGDWDGGANVVYRFLVKDAEDDLMSERLKA